MVLNERDCNVGEDFYSPISATGYLTPLQRKKLREIRKTPVATPFADDFKTPKSAKKPKRPSSVKSVKSKSKTPKEQVPKQPKENHSELRYSVASLVNQGSSDGSTKEKRFFKNRSPQHLQKTEFVMPLSYKKRSLDFSSEKKSMLPTKQNSTVIPNVSAPKENESGHLQTIPNSPVATTPERKILSGKEQSLSPQNENSKENLDQSMEIDCHHSHQIIDVTPKRKKMAIEEQKLSNENNKDVFDQSTEIDCHPTIDVPPKRKKVSIEEQNLPNKNSKDVFDQSMEIDCHQSIDVTPKRKIAKPSKNATKFLVGGDIFSFEWPSDEELLKRQNDARAELKKVLMVRDSKATDVTDVSDVKTVAAMNDIEEQKTASPKLYPIFNNIKVKKAEAKTKGPVSKKSHQCIRDTSKGEEQMIIDAGQKEIGSRVCKTCNMLYAIGHEEDERLHAGYHDTYLLNLKFPGWKTECIVGDFDDGRVIKITDTDKNFMLKKVEDVLYIANRDLGFPTTGIPSKPNLMFFLFISNAKRVGGCLVAEPIESACPVVLGEETDSAKISAESPVWKLGNWYASTTPVKAICGINRIWVAKEFRRKKVASRLIDCLRGCFIYGHVVDCKEMAFTDPSLDGRVFAAAYTGTENFLVYK